MPAASGLNHPNILSVFDVGREGSSDYLITELVDGVTRRDRIGSEGGAAQITGVLVIVVYGVVAQRHVYGGSWLATGVKALGVSVIYGALWSSVVLAVTLWASGSR